MAESVVHTPVKLSPLKRRCFQTFKKAYHEKWSFVTIDEKGDTCLNYKVCSTVVKLLDWCPVKPDQQTALSAAQNP